MYQIHLYVDVSREDALESGSPTAGTKALPLSAEQVAQLRELNLAEAAHPYMGKAPSDYKSNEDRTRAIPAKSHAWESVLEALKLRQDRICEARKILAIEPSWERVAELAALTPERYQIAYAPEDIATCSFADTTVSRLIERLRELTRCVDAVRAGAAPTMSVLDDIDPAWFPADLINAVAARNGKILQDKQEKLEALIAKAHAFISGEPSAVRDGFDTWIAQRDGVPEALCDQVRAVRKSREDALAIEREATYKREIETALAAHGTESQRERWAAGVLPKEEALEVYDRGLFSAFKGLDIATDKTHADSVTSVVEDHNWPAAKAVIEAAKSLKAIDPDLEITWYTGEDPDGDPVHTAYINVTTPIGDRTIEIYL